MQEYKTGLWNLQIGVFVKYEQIVGWNVNGGRYLIYEVVEWFFKKFVNKLLIYWSFPKLTTIGFRLSLFWSFWAQTVRRPSVLGWKFFTTRKNKRLYHEDLKKQEGCGMVTHVSQYDECYLWETSSSISPLFKILKVVNLIFCYYNIIL